MTTGFLRVGLGVIALWLVAVAAGFAQVNIGMSRAEVIEAMGKPESRIAVRNKERMGYPNNVVVHLENGQVVRVEGMDYGYESDQGYMPPASKKPPPPIEFGKPVEPSKQSARTQQSTPSTSFIQQSARDAAQSGTGGIYWERMEEQGETGDDGVFGVDWSLGEDDSYGQEEEIEGPVWVSLLLRFVLYVAFSAIVLYISFQVFGFPLLFMNLLILSVAYSLITVSMDALFLKVPFLGMIPYLDTLISFFALWACIFKFSDVRSAFTALQIAFIGTIVTFFANLFLIQAAIMAILGAQAAGGG